MVDIGTSSGTTEVSRVTVNEIPGTTTFVGAGTAGGPSRRVDVFEDAWVHGNARCGVATVVKVHFPDGGSSTTETPRISTEVSNAELSIVGAGVNNSPNQRLVKVYDNFVVANNATINNDLTVVQSAIVGGILNVTGTSGFSSVTITNTASVGDDLTVSGDVNVGAVGSWGRVRAENAIAAAGTFHVYDRGAGVVANQVCGFGFDAVNPIFFTPTVTHIPLIGIFSAKLLLEIPLLCPVVVVTPWICGQYDETNTTTTPLLIAPATSIPQVLLPAITIKGLPVGPAGAAPAPTTCIQQVEIAFYACGLCTNHIPQPANESAPATDIVFDVKVCGCECTLSE